MDLKEIKQQLNTSQERLCFKIKLHGKEYVQTVRVISKKVDFSYYEIKENKLEQVTDENLLALLICNCEYRARKRVFDNTVFADEFEDLGSSRINNLEVKKWGQQYITSVLCGCKTFAKVFKKSKIKKRMKKLYAIYTEIEDELVSGYQEGNIIALCYKGENGNICTPKDIKSDKRKCKTLIHEGVHFALGRSDDSTGLLNFIRRNNEKTISYTGRSKLYEKIRKLYYYQEYGRGLNEGYTEWIVKKCGFDISTSGYKKLATFIEELEIALGENTVMKLGKGRNIYRLLGMSKNEAYALLIKADRICDNDKKVIELDIAKDELKKDPAEQKQQRMEIARKIQMSTEYREYLLLTHQDDSLDAFSEFCKTRTEELEDENRNLIADFQDEIYNKYFKKELQYVMKNIDKVSPRKIRKYNRLYRLMKRNEDERGEAISDLDKFHKLAVERAKKDIYKKIKDKNITIQNIIDYYRITKSPYTTSQDIFFLGEGIFGRNYQGYYFSKLTEKLFREKRLDELRDYSILRLTNDSINETVFDKDGIFYDKNKLEEAVEIDASCEDPSKIIRFELAEGENIDNLLREFNTFKTKIFENNSGSAIKIAGRVIIVEKGNGIVEFFSFHDGIQPMHMSTMTRIKGYIRDGHSKKRQGEKPEKYKSFVKDLTKWANFKIIQFRSKRYKKSKTTTEKRVTAEFSNDNNSASKKNAEFYEFQSSHGNNNFNIPNRSAEQKNRPEVEELDGFDER